MRKVSILVLFMAILIAWNSAYAEKPTRLYKPVCKQASYTTVQRNSTLWTPTEYDSIVLTAFIISSEVAQDVVIGGSDPVVLVHVGASRPVISPGGFLWKGDVNETLRLLTESDVHCAITLSGWEED